MRTHKVSPYGTHKVSPYRMTRRDLNGIWLLLIFVVFCRVVLVSRPTYQNQTIRVTGIINRDPKIYGVKKLINVNGFSFFVDRGEEFGYGDKVTVVGQVDQQKIVNPKIERVLVTNSFTGRLREKLLTVYQKSLPPVDAGLVAGMTLGSKSLLTKSVWDKVIKSGTAHVTVASGTNVALLAGFGLTVVVYLTKRPRAVLLVMCLIWCYAVLCSLEAPVVRASVMLSLVYLGQATGRPTDRLRILLITFVIMLLVKPNWFYDVGFWLSFLATLGMVLWGRRLGETLSAQLGVLPILLLVFQSFNPWSVVVNLLVLPVVSAITVLGMVGGVVGLMVPILGTYLLYLTIPLTRWFLFWQ